MPAATLLACWTCLGAAAVAAADPIAVATSPDGRVRIELSIRVTDDAATPQYRVLFGETEVIAPSQLQVELDGAGRLGSSTAVVAVESGAVREEFTQVVGKRRQVLVEFAETTVQLRETATPAGEWGIVLRAANDGVAFRYLFRRTGGQAALVIRQESTHFNVPQPGQVRATSHPLDGFTTSYEGRFESLPAARMPGRWLLGLPLLLEYPAGIHAAITEADVHEYAGLYLRPTDRGFTGELAPLPDGSAAVRSPLPHFSPWRVVLLGDRVGQLMESDLVLALNSPCAIPDTSWISTGKTTFPWWNGCYEEGVGFEPGLNTDTAKHYIDFCAEAGIPCHSLDGLDNTAWYGGPITPYEGAQPLQGVAGLDLQEVLAYAKSQGVRIRLWMNWQAAEAHMEQAFPLYRQWGVEGVMLDFMDRDDQELHRFLERAVAWAAENHLTVTLHGCPKPTGLERTYPNLLTYEGVMNLEYDKWDPRGIDSEHELLVPFTRMLAGPLDFHQGSFRTVRPDEFLARSEAPLVIGTPARTLASYVVYQNHLSMAADYPTAYRRHPATRALAAIPTNWDDMQVLAAQVGQYVVVARRHEREWYLGAMTDGDGRSLRVPLDFLETGRFEAEAWLDARRTPHGVQQTISPVTAETELTLDLDPCGGAYVRFTPDEMDGPD